MLESSDEEPGPKKFKTIADGSPGLIFQKSAKGVLYQNDKELPPLFLYGQTTTHNDIHTPSRFKTICTYFYPNALKSVFGINASELTDSCINVELLDGGGSLLKEELLNTESAAAQIDVLSRYLYTQVIKNNYQNDNVLSSALSEILNSKGTISLRELLLKLNVSERTLERRFQETIGLSPKMFSRICRFQASLGLLRKNKFTRLSDIAYENEYADQSHFIRAFKEFSGFTPNDFQKQFNEVIENFPEVV
jgi:AraC-like DNA-binding protein